jgi:putative intracellular protease/amidase
MTDLPPVWLLDVDGVINVNRPGWGAAPRSGTAYADGYGYRMRWAPALIDWIRRLHNTGLVEVRWCTTWCAFADQLEWLWRLPRLERAFTDPLNGREAVEAKQAAARKVLADGRRLVWTDDQVVPTPGTRLYDELTADGRAMLIRPSPRCGLQPADLDAIETFAAAEGAGQ